MLCRIVSYRIESYRILPHRTVPQRFVSYRIVLYIIVLYHPPEEDPCFWFRQSVTSAHDLSVQVIQEVPTFAVFSDDVSEVADMEELIKLYLKEDVISKM